jgi:hypothetical protein
VVRLQHLVVTACVVSAICATAAADPKPTLAVAGIYPQEPEIGKLADTLTTAMRAVAGGRYRVKPTTSKDIAAARLKADCNAVETACAAAMGEILGVEFVLTGELQARGEHPVLVLSLVNVQTKQRIRSMRDSFAKTVDPRRWAEAAYKRIASASVGELVIVANAQHGDVLVDGQLAGALFDGRTMITGIATGTHQLEIRAQGFRPFTVDVSVDGTTRQTLLLEPL